MADLFAELVSSDRVAFAGEVRSVVLLGIEGDMTILPGHAPLLTMLHPGIVFATDAAGTGRRAFVRGGFAEVAGDRLTILAELVLPVEELTRDQLEEEILHLQTQRDGTMDDAARARFDVSIGRLEEYKASLGL
ncbi:F-type H+-transporting ATPase subunit epsilon [Methylobacterium sp. BE186]|uniref:ATP synthase F1 subunit epsilon n=1 Tax=Methylobacterium sp. BE186 TaxID=2817715 RepID=UPI0028634417|nr:ATP synthase F1 subunit epsilon [Methylobacterium sp. BE186]MDR7036026.1 F-type H+-transporting ATPase subunit epsilon [Methylobacterium sp. BE186]